MWKLRIKELVKKVLQAFGIMKADDGVKHSTFNKPWYRSSDFYRYAWRRRSGESQEQPLPEDSEARPECEKDAAHHTIKQP